MTITVKGWRTGMSSGRRYAEMTVVYEHNDFDRLKALLVWACDTGREAIARDENDCVVGMVTGGSRLTDSWTWWIYTEDGIEEGHRMFEGYDPRRIPAFLTLKPDNFTKTNR